MELVWLGTAGFIVKAPEGTIAFDPFLSRGPGARLSPFSTRSFGDVEGIFLGHGHFDHAFDVPQIINHTEAKVFSPGLTGRLLKVRGVPDSRLWLSHNTDYLHKSLKLRGHKSAHVRFDRKLVTTTATRCGVGGCMHILKLGFEYPKGLVQTYSFVAGGKKILFISSLGCTKPELEEYRKEQFDILLAPLQGHSEIQKMAAEMTKVISPKIVIPHHHDDFYPPMSQDVSVDTFRDELRRVEYKGECVEIPLFSNAEI